MADAGKLPMSKQLSVLESMLMTKKFPSMSQWWHATLKRFYESDCRQLVLRCGRRGGKSSTLCRVAVLEAVYGDHQVPPGDVGIVGIVSVTIDEARSRLKTVRDILDAMGIGYRDTKEALYLHDKPVKFQVFAASFKAVVGGTWICAICDEVSRWRDNESGANPAFEVLASLRPTMATMPNARMFLSSSPLGMTDAHAKAVEEGDNDFQIVSEAPTWIANPTITEAATHRLERNERVWKREYAAIPQGALSSVFSLTDIDAAIDLGEALVIEGVGQAVLCIDPSRGHDSWTYCVARWVWHDKRQRMQVVEVGEVPNASDTRASVDWLVNKGKLHGCTQVASDQYDASGLAVLFSEKGLSYFQNTWSAKSKKTAVDRMDRFLRDRDIALPDHDMMRRHMAEYSEKISRSGGDPTYSGRGAHDDYAAVLLTLIMLELAKRIPMATSPSTVQPVTQQIEQKWYAAQEGRIAQRKLDEKDWNIVDYETMFDNERYLP